MEVKPKIIPVFLIALFAEVGASLWLMLLVPSDSPIETYSGLLGYEMGRVICWAPLAAFITLLFTVVQRRLPSPKDGESPRNSNSLAVFILSVAAVGLLIETITSLCFWKGPHSTGVQELYESIWYWHRVPSQSDFGWPSFRGYFLDHLVPWAVLFLTGLFAWFVWNRRRRLLTARGGKPINV